MEVIMSWKFLGRLIPEVPGIVLGGPVYVVYG